MTARRVTGSDETVTVTVRSRTGEASARAHFTVKASPAPAPVVVQPAPQPANPTVTGVVYAAGDNFAYVTVTTNDADGVYYYFVAKAEQTTVPSAEWLKDQALTNNPLSGYAEADAREASFVLYPLTAGDEYVAFVTAVDAQGNLSAVHTVDMAADQLDGNVDWIPDPSVPDGICVIVHRFDAGYYYVLADEPIQNVTADVIKAQGTLLQEDEHGMRMFTFPLSGQPRFLYIVYEIGGTLQDDIIAHMFK